MAEKGFGLRTSAFDYRITGRGGQGIENMELRRRDGDAVIAVFPVSDDEEVMLVADGGIVIRCPVTTCTSPGGAAGHHDLQVGDGEGAADDDRQSDAGEP